MADIAKELRYCNLTVQGEAAHINVWLQRHIKAADEIERLRNGIAQICDGLERGDIGEDVTWFNDYLTLWEFCAEFIGREEPLGDALPQPTQIDRQYMQLCKDAESWRAYQAGNKAAPFTLDQTSQTENPPSDEDAPTTD